MLICEAVMYEKPTQKDGIQIDENLLARIAAEDMEAFCSLYEICSPAVFAYALSILRNRENAEDAMQDTFLKIRSAAHLYQPRGKPMAWILTITRNICLMMFRQRAHLAGMSDKQEIQDFGLDRIGNAEDRLTLEKAFTVLSEDTCTIIMLHAVGGMKHRETAALLQMPLSTVLSKYNRGIKRLRSELEGLL